MYLKYTPKDGEARRWVIDFTDLDLAEVQDIELYSGMTFAKFVRSFEDGRMGHLRILLYVLLKRDNQGLLYRDVRPKFAEIAMEHDRAELEELRDRVMADPDWPDREETLAELDKQLAEMADEEPGKDDPVAPSPTLGNRASRRRGKSTA